MKDKKLITLLALSATFACFAAPPPTPQAPPVPQEAQQEPGVATQGMQEADCNGLTSQEQLFANRLTMANRKLFCGKFNAVERAKVMQMSGSPDPDGNLMSPDQAVQKIDLGNKKMKDSGKMQGACPVQ